MVRHRGNDDPHFPRRYYETFHYKGLVDYVSMDSKGDDYDLFREFNRQRKMTLVTYCRENMDKTQKRQEMIKVMNKPEHKAIYKERSYRVEPMQGLVKEIFNLDRCWMRGNKSNRWLFAAMGITVQMYQRIAFKESRSTSRIKEEVLG